MAKSMKKPGKELRFSWEHIKDFCKTLTEAEDALTREMVSRISDKWSLWTMSVIAELGQPMRFSRIMDGVEGISQSWLWAGTTVQRFQDCRAAFDRREILRGKK